MKFKLKVLIANLIIISISIGVVGYVQLRRNFALYIENMISDAVAENNLIQATLEYELLREIKDSSAQEVTVLLDEMGRRANGSILNGHTTIYIRYGDQYAYLGDEKYDEIPKSVYSDVPAGRKNYIISESVDNYYVFVSSGVKLLGRNLSVITKRDVTSVYDILDGQLVFFRLLLVGTLIVAGLIMYIISRILTRPLDSLNKATEAIADGDYAVRAEIKTQDEIGVLAEKFNRMASAVSEHVVELNEMLHRKEQFVANFTHEIKTPMTSIIGYADTMRSVELPREKEMLAANYIFTEGKRLEVMSQKLFEILYLRDHEIDMHTLDILDIIEAAMLSTEPALSEKNIRLNIEAEDAFILGVRELLVSVLINIIDNSRKASEQTSKIDLLGRVDGEKYILSISDHGIGMNDEQIKHIYDEFYMADKSRSRQEGGAGLGMSLVAVILRRHNASINIESELGEGTCVSIEFALAKEAEDEE